MSPLKLPNLKNAYLNKQLRSSRDSSALKNHLTGRATKLCNVCLTRHAENAPHVLKKPGSYAGGAKSSISSTINRRGSGLRGIPSGLTKSPKNRHSLRQGEGPSVVGQKKNSLGILSIRTPGLNKSKTPYKRKVRDPGVIGLGRAPGVDLIGTYS